MCVEFGGMGGIDCEARGHAFLMLCVRETMGEGPEEVAAGKGMEGRERERERDTAALSVQKFLLTRVWVELGGLGQRHSPSTVPSLSSQAPHTASWILCLYIYLACTLSSILQPFLPQLITRSCTSPHCPIPLLPPFSLAGFLFAQAACHRESGKQVMADTEERKNVDETMPSPEEEEAAIKRKYGGIMPKKPPLISKDHERAYFDSADWALGKTQGAQPDQKPKSLVESLRPKLQPTPHQPLPSRKASYSTSECEDEAVAATEEAS